MARSNFGKLLGLSLVIGGGAGLLARLGDRPARAATLPTRKPVRTPAHRATRAASLAAEPVAERPQAAAAPMTPTYEFPPEVLTHSPEFLAAEAARKAQPATAPQGKMAAAAPTTAPAQGGTTMANRQARIAELLGLVKAEADAGRKRALQDELVKLAKEEQAALQAAAAPTAPQPTYPIGLEASFGDKWVKILEAWRVPDGSWSYAVDARLGMLFGLGDGKHTLTEAEIRGRLAEALGPLQPGQAFPRGIKLYRNGQGGLVTGASPGPGGAWTYALQGWPNAVTQAELQAILRRA